MTDNTALNLGSGGANALTYEVTFSGDTTVLQGVTLFGVSGTEGSYTIANVVDPTHGVLVNMGGNNDVTVTSGAVTATLSATDNAVLDTIDAVLDLINAKLVAGTVIGDVNLGAVDNAVLDAILADTTAILADTAAIQTAAELIDDAIYVDDGDWTATTSKHMLTGGVYTSTSRVLTDGDTGPFSLDVNGHVITSGHAEAVALADNVSNTANIIVDEAGAFVAQPSFGYMFDGSTWDRIRGDATNGVLVNMGANNDVTVTSGTIALSATDNAVLDTIDAVLDLINAKLVTGTVIGDVNLGAVDNAVLDAIAASVATVAGAVSGIEMQVDVVTSALPSGAATAAAQLAAGHNVTVLGEVAHDAADSGNPVKIGAKAVAFDGTAPGTDVAEDDVTDLKATLDGRVFVEETHPNFWDASADYATAQTNATVKAAPGAGLKLYITDVIISNGATAGNITLLDGSGGTVLLELYPAINGGLTHRFRSPIALTANTLLAITSTTVTTHSVTVSGFIAA